MPDTNDLEPRLERLKTMLPLSRVKITPRGLRGHIVPRHIPMRHHGLVVSHTQDGYIKIISDGVETPSAYHPDFWEPEPDYIIPTPYPDIACFNGLEDTIRSMPPSSRARLTAKGLAAGLHPRNQATTGTVIAWVWWKKEGQYKDCVKVLPDGMETVGRYDPDLWEAIPEIRL